MNTHDKISTELTLYVGSDNGAGNRDVVSLARTGADLSVVISASPDTVAPGGLVTYRIDVTNLGPPVPIPLMGGLATLLMTLLICLAGMFKLRRYSNRS